MVWRPSSLSSPSGPTSVSWLFGGIGQDVEEDAQVLRRTRRASRPSPDPCAGRRAPRPRRRRQVAARIAMARVLRARVGELTVVSFGGRRTLHRPALGRFKLSNSRRRRGLPATRHRGPVSFPHHDQRTRPLRSPLHLPRHAPPQARSGAARAAAQADRRRQPGAVGLEPAERALDHRPGPGAEGEARRAQPQGRRGLRLAAGQPADRASPPVGGQAPAHARRGAVAEGPHARDPGADRRLLRVPDQGHRRRTRRAPAARCGRACRTCCSPRALSVSAPRRRRSG